MAYAKRSHEKVGASAFFSGTILVYRSITKIFYDISGDAFNFIGVPMILGVFASI